jgi:Tol biopolymer transport system component
MTAQKVRCARSFCRRGDDEFGLIFQDKDCRMLIEQTEGCALMKMLIGSLLTKAKRHFFAIIAGGILVAAPILYASPVQLLSARDSSIVLLPGGNGDSVAPWISDDGRFVVFSSLANDLAPGGNSQQVLNVYLRDRSLNTTELVSANAGGTGGGNGHSMAGQASAYGRYVVFQSDASDLVPGDTNGVTDIFLRDTFTGTTLLISEAADGGCANGASTDPVMTPDGTCVAFISTATNLVAGDTNGIADVFVRDLITQTTRLVSVKAAGNGSPPVASMATPVITPDGRFVAFFSDAKGLATGVPSTTTGEVYVRDRLAGTTIWASANAAATVSTVLHLNSMPSTHPALSDDGRYVAFKTGWTNGIGTLGSPSVAAVIFFLYDSLNRTTTMVNTNGYPPWPNCDDVYGPEMTPDGRFIAFVQCEITGSTPTSSVRLWDRQTGTNVLVSADASGLWPSNSTSHTPALSQDGRYVTFLSDATNLVSNTVSNGLHIYRRDLQTTTTVLLDADTNGIGSMDQLGTIPALSADGQSAAFSALDGGLIGRDNNNAPDVFLWDATTGTNELISARDPLALTQSGNGVSTLGPLSISGNGGLVAFASYASDLVSNDFNGAADVFVRNLTANTNLLVSVGMDGKSGIGGPSSCPVISADGRFVTFISGATNLVAGDNVLAYKVFRRDLQTGTTVLVSINSGGVNGKYDAFWPVSSQDGRYIAFLCRTNSSVSLLGVLTNLFWQDMNSSLTLSVGGAHPSRAISMSADGQRVAYFDSQSRLYVWDANLQANIYTNTTASLTSAAISPAGNRLLYLAANQLFVRDLAGASDTFLCPSTVQIKGSSQWSGDGRYVAFVTATNLVAGDNNGTNDVYLQDLQTGILTLVSMNQSGTASAAGVSDSPVVSADGRFVVFRSFATNVLPGIVRPPSLVVFDRLSGLNSLLVTGTAGTGWTTWVSQPALSTNKLHLAFQSWDAGLVSGDLNGVGDTFALTNWPAVDSDGDGIPDWWMIQYFGHPTGQAGDLSRAQDDADGDGMNNLQEFLAGTIPTNPASVLTLHIVADASGTNVLMNWGVAPGKNFHYQVLSATNLSNPVWSVFPGSVGMIGSQRYFNVPATNSQRYFRIWCGN